MASQLLSNPTTFKLALQLYAIKKSLSQFGKPTIRKDDATGQTTVEGEDTDEAIMAAAPYMVQILAGVAFLLGGMTLYFFSSLLVDFACICLLVVAPLVVAQKFKLQSLGDLRGQHNALRQKCNVFAGENNKLHSTITGMEGQMERLSDVEEGLSKIANQSGTQVNRLVEIVKENGELQIKVKKALERQVMQGIVDAVVTSDKDGNFTLSPKETEMLKLRLKNIDGINLNEQNFNKMIASDENELTVPDVMNMVRNLLDDDIPRDRNVFTLDPESLLKSK